MVIGKLGEDIIGSHQIVTGFLIVAKVYQVLGYRTETNSIIHCCLSFLLCPEINCFQIELQEMVLLFEQCIGISFLLINI